jgi:Uridine kinase
MQSVRDWERLVASVGAAMAARAASARPALVVGVSGFGGAGKSTLARRLAACVPEGSAVVIPADDFWVPERDGRSSDWASYDWPRLRAQVLLPARAGHPVRYQPRDPREAPEGDGWREVPDSCRCLIVEGVGLFQPDLLPLFDLRVWVDCPLAVAAARGIRRDREEYGMDTEADWRDRWVPNDREFFERFQPNLSADLVVLTRDT